MNLNNAIEKHAEWKFKFRKAITGRKTMDAETIANDNCCDLGKWLHGEAESRFGHFSSYAECVKRHAVFHAEAGKVAKAINAKKYTEAEAIINSDSSYNLASVAVGLAIMHLKKEAGM